MIQNNDTAEETWKQVQAAWSQIEGAQAEEAIQAEVQRVEVQPEPEPQPGTAPAGKATMRITSLDIIRGMPKNAEQIAQLIQQQTGEELSRTDVLMAFGQKSYMMAIADDQPVGLVGFLVENLVTRVDEFLVIDQAPIQSVSTALIQAIERASRELQSEVGYVFVLDGAPAGIVRALEDQGYEDTALEDIKVPAWREAVREARPDGAKVFAKKLRAERVLKPL